jgi:hypothetical protein
MLCVSCLKGLQKVQEENPSRVHWVGTQVVQELKRECAGRDASGRRREASAVAWSLQRYLIFAILSCIPGKFFSMRLAATQAWLLLRQFECPLELQDHPACLTLEGKTCMCLLSLFNSLSPHEAQH